MTRICTTVRAGRRRWLPGRLIAVLAIVLAGEATPGTALADPEPSPGGYLSAEVRARMDAQQPLKTAASLIQWSVERGSAAGYAGIGLGTGEVVVWWKGGLPAGVAETVAEVRRTTPVRVVAASHSRAELEKAAKGVENYLRVNPGSPYHSVNIAYDGSGLVVNADPSRTRPAVLPAGMRLPAGIAATVVEQERPRLAWSTPPVKRAALPQPAGLVKIGAGRLDDFAPYFGGGRIQNNDNNSFCTAGFPVISGDGYYMLTAGHCGRPGGSWNNGDDTRFLGTGAYENVEHDLLLVSASVWGAIWDGGVGSGEFTKGVAGWDWVWPGEWLCTSGSVTGAQCNDVVSNSFTYALCDNDAYGNRECYNDLIVAYQYDGLTASRPGDSGGPVFGLSGWDHVIAKGTITGHVGTTGLIFQDFATAWRDFGVIPVTG